MENVRYPLREEGEIIWRIFSQDSELASLCKETVCKYEQQYVTFSIERDRIVQAFGKLCVRSLEFTFIRPLLLIMWLLEEYVEVTFPVPDAPTIRCKLDALFEDHARTWFYRQSVVEHYGVNNFKML